MNYESITCTSRLLFHARSWHACMDQASGSVSELSRRQTRARLYDSACIGLYGPIVTNIWARIANTSGITAGAAS